jgi:hypothetical protein
MFEAIHHTPPLILDSRRTHSLPSRCSPFQVHCAIPIPTCQHSAVSRKAEHSHGRVRCASSSLVRRDLDVAPTIVDWLGGIGGTGTRCVVFAMCQVRLWRQSMTRGSNGGRDRPRRTGLTPLHPNGDPVYCIVSILRDFLFLGWDGE